MESNGKKECIHASQETADILFGMGKGHWVHTRAERITAKGKGELQTFWINTTSGESAAFEEIDLEEEAEEEEMDQEEKEIAELEEALQGVPGTEAERREMLKWARKNYRSMAWTFELLCVPFKGISWERRRETDRSGSSLWNGVDFAGLDVHWDTCLHQALFNLSDSTGQRGSKAWEVTPENVKNQLKLFVFQLTFAYKDEAAFFNLEKFCQILMAADKMMKQYSLTLGFHQQFNAWVKFTVFLAAIIGDVKPSSFGGMARTAGSAEQQHQVAYSQALERAWALLMDDSLADLRGYLCVNEQELSCFRQLLVNLVFAGDISGGFNSPKREERWKDVSEGDLHQHTAMVLEHISMAAQWTHTMQLWETYKKWNSLCYQELCDDLDHNDLIAVDPGVDWFSNELMLFDTVILPLSETLQQANVLGATGSEMAKHASHNRRGWSRMFLSRS